MLFLTRFITKKTAIYGVVGLIILFFYFAHVGQLNKANKLVVEANEKVLEAKKETIEIVKAEKVFAEKQIEEIEDEVYYNDTTSGYDTF